MIEHIKHLLLRLTDHRPVIKCDVAALAPNVLLKGHCALITGGTSGIGYSIAEAFMKSGSSVIITGRSQERLDKTCLKLSGFGRIRGYVMDNTDVNSFDAVFSQMIKDNNKTWGGQKIDILVNNAGVQGAEYPNATENEYDAAMDTNLKACFFLSQLIGNYMVQQGVKGNILNVCSSSSLRPAISAYTISKWGLRGLTLGLAKSLIQHGIVVNGIAPGATATPMLNKSNSGDMSYPHSPIGRYILPEEIASMAVHLVSDMGRCIVGDIVYMTGGMGLITFDDINYNVFK